MDFTVSVASISRSHAFTCKRERSLINTSLWVRKLYISSGISPQGFASPTRPSRGKHKSGVINMLHCGGIKSKNHLPTCTSMQSIAPASSRATLRTKTQRSERVPCGRGKRRENCVSAVSNFSHMSAVLLFSISS